MQFFAFGKVLAKSIACNVRTQRADVLSSKIAIMRCKFLGVNAKRGEIVQMEWIGSKDGFTV